MPEIDHPGINRLEKLSKETLINVIKMYSSNWMAVDGLWFSGVEEKCGMDAAMELDVPIDIERIVEESILLSILI